MGSEPDPREGRAGKSSSDLAKGSDGRLIPEKVADPKGCGAGVHGARVYGENFRADVVIDLIGYRRYGHNEADEPAYTQPEMYQRIRKHERAREIYAQQLVDAGVVEKTEVQALDDEVNGRLTREHQALKAHIEEAQHVEH